ncbi:MAG: DUF1543 domain-containing protein [Cyanobacteriota bacterium]|nr:DUF1543 domain-containing protein [Cyanobacteriota bacterium]
MGPPREPEIQDSPGPLTPSPQLFLVVLGGRVPGVHIELHDVRFVVGPTLEDTLPALRRQWFGRRRGLHIDSWMVVRQVGAFAVELHREPPDSLERLWFVNVGGYRADQLAEEHAFGLVVAATAAAAKRQALATWLPEALLRHKDDLHPLDRVGGPEALGAVDDCLPLDTVDGWRVHLRAVAEPPPPQRPDWFGYRPI